MMEIDDEFQLPIYYLKNKQEISNHISNDLELEDTSDVPSLYRIVFDPKSSFASNNISLWNKYYTSDVSFLKDTQKLISSKHFNDIKIDFEHDNIIDIWKQIQNDNDPFIEKYQYIDWPIFQNFNNNSSFLQFWSVYNMASPILSLALPILMLIIPFFILKLQGISLTISVYFDVLQKILSKHHIGQLFQLGQASWDKRIYIFVSLFFYILQIYQNVLTCIKFFSNISTIHNQLFIIRNYIQITLNNMEVFEAKFKSLKSYTPFIDKCNHHKNSLLIFYNDLLSISPYKISISKFYELGHLMKCFYQLYNNKVYISSLKYSFGFNGYLENIIGFKNNQNLMPINKTRFTNKKSFFKNAYFPAIKNPIKNTYNLEKHALITGPNAAGKTTILKTTIFNILISQQIGYGFFDKANFKPFDFIHCYINIPDTSGRDSLFQAEARRCKNILEQIKNDNFRHFCIFDELYSGTNPYEAIGSAVAFLSYLNNFSNIKFMITTHFLDLCKKLKTNSNFANYHMKIISDENNFKYVYKLDNGISNIKGGVKVLKDLDYPDVIIDNASKIINKLSI